MKQTRQKLIRSCLAIVAACGLLQASGCNIVTPIAYVVHGPGKVKKVATLDPAMTYVIFIDDPSSKISSRRLRSTIADTAQEDLLNRGVVTKMIDGRAAITSASNERYGERLSVQAIGAGVGADVVIYGLLTQFSMAGDAGGYQPSATLQVKIVDVNTGDRVWPFESEEELFPLSITMPPKPGMAPTSTSSLYTAQEELSTQLGLALAQLFYDVEVPQSARVPR